MKNLAVIRNTMHIFLTPEYSEENSCSTCSSEPECPSSSSDEEDNPCPDPFGPTNTQTKVLQRKRMVEKDVTRGQDRSEKPGTTTNPIPISERRPVKKTTEESKRTGPQITYVQLGNV